jgi:hypothetical protein
MQSYSKMHLFATARAGQAGGQAYFRRFLLESRALKMVHWTCSTTPLLVEQVLQNTVYFAAFIGVCVVSETSFDTGF